jgi:hypothetical protein
MKTNDYKQERAIQLLFTKKNSEKYLSREYGRSVPLSIFLLFSLFESAPATPWQIQQMRLCSSHSLFCTRKQRRRLQHPT